MYRYTHTYIYTYNTLMTLYGFVHHLLETTRLHLWFSGERLRRHSCLIPKPWARVTKSLSIRIYNWNQSCIYVHGHTCIRPTMYMGLSMYMWMLSKRI